MWGKLHVRFDDGGQILFLRKILDGHEVGNSGCSQESSEPNLNLPSTLPCPLLGKCLTLDDKLLGQTQRGETDDWSAWVRVV
jgi:hypothetical protein